MKNTIFSFLTAAGLLFAGCHQPDELLPSVSRNGINSVTAQFVKNNSEGAAEFYGEFKGYPAEGSDEITVEIPWFYPESSDDVVSGKMLDKMRISLNLDDNVTVDPAVLYMNLNEDNYITVTDQLKQKKVYKVRGRIVKSKACLLEELSLPSQGLNAIIDQETKEVSLIAAGNIEPCTGTYRLSYHATISPDPATTVIDWNASPKLTVTAYDGVSKTVYTVKKEVPAKVPTGIRSGSQKNLFVSETFKTDYGMSGTTNYTLGILGDHLLICSGESEIVYVNKLTGVKAGTVNMGGINLGGGAITSDEANHIVMCSIAANGASQTIYRLDHVTDTPKEVMTWSNATGGKIGSKISIKGDIDADAVVTINCWAWASPANWSSFVRIIVTDGVWGTPEKVTIAGCGLWNGGNVDICRRILPDLISKPAIRPMGRSGSTERPIRVWHLSTKARTTPIRILPMCRAPSSIRVRSSPCSAVRTSLTVHRVPSCSMSETVISSPGRSTIRKPRSMRRRLNIWLFPERRAAISC